MDTKELFAYVDHTLLKPYAPWDAIGDLCREALAYQMASVCIPGSYVKKAHESFPGITIGTVVGFPLGYSPTEAKLAETVQALKDGASEIDMVINICDVKNGNYRKVQEEITRLKEAAGEHILKVIIETCYLQEDEKIALCRAVTDASADYIKTSTGFGATGAVLEDIFLMKAHIGPAVKIKAAGGIRSREEMERFIQAGCSRIGTSSAVSMLLE